MPLRLARRDRPLNVKAGIVLAISGLGLLAGCGEPTGSAPRTAAEAGRGVIDSETDDPPPDPAGPQVPDPLANSADEGTGAPSQAADSTETESSPSEAIGEAVIAGTPSLVPVQARKPAVEKDNEKDDRPGAQAMANIRAEPTGDPSRYPGGIVPVSPTAQPLPGGPRLLVPKKKFRTAGDPPALQVTYDDLDLLKVLNLGSPIPEDAVKMLPDWLKALDGKRIRIRGFMYPAYSNKLTNFVLTRDMGACCFGPNPRIYYLIAVKLKEGTSVQYIPGRPFDVVGTFHISPFNDEGTWFQLWSITDAVVIE